MCKVVYSCENGIVTDNYDVAMANKPFTVNYEKIAEPVYMFIPKNGLHRVKAVKPTN